MSPRQPPTEQSGQSLVEYAMILALMMLVSVLLMKAVGTHTAGVFSTTQEMMTNQGVATTSSP